MRDIKIIDMHCDTLLECYIKQTSLRNGDAQINLEKLKQGGSLAQCFAIFVVSNDAAERNKIALNPYDFYKEMLALFRREVEKNSDLILQALCVEDILRNERQNKLSAILTIEDAVPLDGKIERVDEFFDDGVRMMSLTWNYENSLAYPNHTSSCLHEKGLKPFGFEVVERMNELGMIVDVSHLSEGGFDDVSQVAQKPFVASHSCARALGSHQRNLTDRQLKVLGEQGGMVGINFCAEFLEDGSTFSSIKNIVKHLVYIKDKAGIDALGWGSDFDGIEGNVLEYKNYAGFPMILNELSKHFSEAEIDKINSKNFLRVFKDNIGI
ncbi:MAG: membrane dipeptidase [Clostridia bacterium]|nr:membrane dipeptidase [Clostridia bacterium]